jgi:hypothetical protein
MENFFEENDRAAGLSPVNDTQKIMNADAGCPLEECQLGSFDSVDSADDRKLLLRESSNGDGSGTSHSTVKIANKSTTGRMPPLPSPSNCFVSLPAASSSSHVATTPLAPPSISDLFSSPDNNKGTTTPLHLPKKKGGSVFNIFESPCAAEPTLSSRFFLNIQPANSFSDLLTTSSNEERHETIIQSTSTSQAAAASSGITQEGSNNNGESGGFGKPSHKDIMQTLKDTAEIEIHLPTPLGDNLEGHRRFVINGPLKKCTDSSIDRINAHGNDEAFYQFLQMSSPAFEGCTFLLPWLRASETKSKVHVSLFGSFRLNKGTLIRPMSTGPSETDLEIAKRRIRSSICAFGGTINSKKEEEDEHPPAEKFVSFTRHKSKSSIFRSKSSDASKPSLSSSSSSKSAGLKRKRKNKSIMRREKYEKKLRDQYFENGNRLSWDVQHSLKLTLSGAKTFDEEDNSDSSSNKQHSAKTDKDGESNRPTKYKCTMCGALKKKHVCTNRPTILRNIGVNVYPAVNAYAADEPGSLTCALSEMNNFITSSSNSVCGLTTSEEVGRRNTTLPAHVQVTTSLPSRGDSVKTYLRKSILSGLPKRHQLSCEEEEESRNHSINLIFQPSMEIIHDQFLKVKTLPTDRDYTYPAVPLTFGQRKSMSDALLSISKSVPGLTQACALILKDARKKGQWDQAVAELMAQVLCILKCSFSKDYSLEGLKRYLLEFGISC